MKTPVNDATTAVALLLHGLQGDLSLIRYFSVASAGQPHGKYVMVAEGSMAHR